VSIEGQQEQGKCPRIIMPYSVRVSIADKITVKLYRESATVQPTYKLDVQALRNLSINAYTPTVGFSIQHIHHIQFHSG
jgi:malic enzyme